MATRSETQPADQAGAEQADQVVGLLELLAADAPVAEIAAADAPSEARDLALRIASAREVHQHREAGLAALLDTARELATESDPGSVLDAIVRRARRLVGTDLAYLTLYDPEAGDTFMRATDGSVSAVFQSVRLALGAGLGGLVASTHKPYWTADYWADERFRHTNAIDGAVGEEGIIAICGTPLIVEKHFVGVLFAANRSSRPFTREEVGLLGNLATLAAVTLVQTRALADAENALAALSDAHETVRQYAEGVEKAAAAHDRFASLVLGGGGVDDITHALAELLGGWAVLVDEHGHRHSASGPAPAHDDTGSDPFAALDAIPDLGAGRLVERDGVYAVAVTAARERLGTIYVGGLTLSDSDQRTVERAGVVTALVLLFERQAADARQSARNRLVSDLVSARGSREERLTLARAVGFDPQKPFCLLVLRGDEPTGHRALLISASAATGEASLVGSHDGDVIALVPGTDADGLARAVAARIGKRTCVTVAGVGPVSDVDDIERGARGGAPHRRRAHRARPPGQGRCRDPARLRRAHRRIRSRRRRVRPQAPGPRPRLRRAARHRPRRARWRHTSRPVAARGTPPARCTSTSTRSRSASSASQRCSGRPGSIPTTRSSCRSRCACAPSRPRPDPWPARHRETVISGKVHDPSSTSERGR